MTPSLRLWTAEVRGRFSAGLAPTLLFGFVAHVAVAVVGALAIPFYLSLMGEEAYGLVGFYLVLQAWMPLMDFGVSPTVGRQLSRYKAGALSPEDAVSLLAAGETVFLLGGLIAGATSLHSTGWLADHWLGRSRLPAQQVDLALRLAGCLLVLRWLANLYQSALIGLERQVAVNAVALVCTIARNVGAILGLILFSRSPGIVFAVWVGVTLVEAAVNRLLLLKAMPTAPDRRRNGWRLLSKHFRFAAGLTLSAAITIAISQADKLALSHKLSLGDFGAFSLVVTICSGIAIIVPPTVQAFQPRLTTLLAQGRRSEFVEVYRLAISLIIAVAAGLAATIAVQPVLVVYAWTGNHEIARHLAPTLSLYALGSGIAAILFVPYVLQFAEGYIRLHVISNIVFGAVWIPGAIWAALTFGTVGAGVAWLTGNLLFLLVYVPIVHRRLLSPEERQGISLGAGLRIVMLAALLFATRLVNLDRLDRIASFVLLAAISLTVMVGAALSSRELRAYISGMIGYSGAFSR